MNAMLLAVSLLQPAPAFEARGDWFGFSGGRDEGRYGLLAPELPVSAAFGKSLADTPRSMEIGGVEYPVFAATEDQAPQFNGTVFRAVLARDILKDFLLYIDLGHRRLSGYRSGAGGPELTEWLGNEWKEIDLEKTDDDAPSLPFRVGESEIRVPLMLGMRPSELPGVDLDALGFGPKPNRSSWAHAFVSATVGEGSLWPVSLRTYTESRPGLTVGSLPFDRIVWDIGKGKLYVPAQPEPLAMRIRSLLSIPIGMEGGRPVFLEEREVNGVDVNGGEIVEVNGVAVERLHDPSPADLAEAAEKPGVASTFGIVLKDGTRVLVTLPSKPPFD